MPVTTRAAVAFAPKRPMEIVEVSVSDPGPGQVMIRLLATGLCHSDLHVLDGSSVQQFPIVLGHEGAGEVIAIGDGVHDFAVGDYVVPYLVPDCGRCAYCRSGRTNFCDEFLARRKRNWSPFSIDGMGIGSFMGLGTFAETTVVEADMVTKVDPRAPAEHACCIGCGITTGLGAALITAKVEPGSSVAVFGAGGVGLSVVQGARLAGAERIIVVDINPAKAGVAEKLGATDFIDPRATPDVISKIRQITGLGVDFAFECVGRTDLALAALESTNPAWGTAVNVGVFSAGSNLSTPPFNLVAGRRWTGSLMGGAKRSDVAKFVDMYVAGAYGLDQMISHKFQLEDINIGFELMQKGESVRSVVIF